MAAGAVDKIWFTPEKGLFAAAKPNSPQCHKHNVLGSPSRPPGPSSGSVSAGIRCPRPSRLHFCCRCRRLWLHRLLEPHGLCPLLLPQTLRCQHARRPAQMKRRRCCPAVGPGQEVCAVLQLHPCRAQSLRLSKGAQICRLAWAEAAADQLRRRDLRRLGARPVTGGAGDDPSGLHTGTLLPTATGRQEDNRIVTGQATGFSCRCEVSCDQVATPSQLPNMRMSIYAQPSAAQSCMNTHALLPLHSRQALEYRRRRLFLRRQLNSMNINFKPRALHTP